MACTKNRVNASGQAASTLTQLTLGVIQEMLREGVQLKVGTDITCGIRIELGEEVMLDPSDEALSRLLLAHLRPRLRQILEGIVDV